MLVVGDRRLGWPLRHVIPPVTHALARVIVSATRKGKAKSRARRIFVHLFKKRMKIALSRAKLSQSGGFVRRDITPGRM